MSDLQNAIDLLRSARERALPSVVEEIDEFIELMETPVVRIRIDCDPMNPRTEYDNVGVMYCKHGRYNLGDKDAEDPYIDEEFKTIRGIEITADQYEDDLPDAIKHAYDEDDALRGVPRDSDDFSDNFNTLFENEWEDTRWQSRRVLRPDIALILPLYLYDHGGITISHGSFSCPWDSGQVGWHYMTKEAVQREWGGDLEKAEKYMEGELETYDQYLRGECYGFEIETRSGEHVDSCWGFFGDDIETNGMLEYIPKELHYAAREAWERRFE